MEAAKELQVTKNTIHAWIKSGKLTGHRIGKPYYMTEESIREVMEPETADSHSTTIIKAHNGDVHPRGKRFINSDTGKRHEKIRT